MKIFKVIFIILALSFTLSFTLSAREKTMTIGKLKWFTEQNSIEEIAAIAAKEKKPIMVVFSASWCGPCQAVKKDVFEKDGFKKVSDIAVLLYIEQTDPKGMAFCKKFKIEAYPTFKALDETGREIDHGNPARTIEGFHKWMTAVRAGDTLSALKYKIKKNPNDRDALIKLADKLNYSKHQEKISLYEKVIGNKPDYNDSLTIHAFSRVLYEYRYVYSGKKGDEAQKYLANADKKVSGFFNAFSPESLKDEKAKRDAYRDFIYWNTLNKRFKKAADAYKTYMKGIKSFQLDKENVHFHQISVEALLKNGDFNTALKILTNADSYLENNKKTKVDIDNVIFSYLNIGENVVSFYINSKKDLSKADETANQIEKRISELRKAGRLSNNSKMFVSYIFLNWAKEYGLLSKSMIDLMDHNIKISKNYEMKLHYAGEKAKILQKTGKTQEARQVILSLVKESEGLDTIKDKEKMELLNSAAWTLYELNMADSKALELAEKSVAIKKLHKNLDTLAVIHAAQGNYKKAIQTEEEAVKLAKRESDKKGYLDKINSWKKTEKQKKS
jgi:thioredoxin 1